MTGKSRGLDDELHAYLLGVGVREPAILARLRDETAAMPQSHMQIAPEQGAFMAFLVEALGARRCLEVAAQEKGGSARRRSRGKTDHL